MNKFKIFWSLVSVVVVLLSVHICVSVFNVDAASGQESNKRGYLTEQDVFEALSYTFDDNKLTNRILKQTTKSPSGVTISSFNSEDFSRYTNNEYGGMYLDDDGTLVVCFVDNSDYFKRVNEILSSSRTATNALVNSEEKVIVENYTVKSVKYSESELLAAYELVNSYIAETGLVKTADVSPIKNRIILGVTEASDIETVKKALSAIENMIDFEVLDDDFKVEEIATINGTSEIHNNQYSSTQAGRLYSSSLNQYGIITCGHNWNVNDNVYCDVLSIAVKIGTVENRIYTSNNDSSFIVLNSDHQYQDTKTDELSSSVPVVGSTITLRGFVSGRVDAEVLSVNSSTSGFTGLIRCNKVMQSGDSGGGAIGGIIDSGRTACIVAINKAVSNTSTYLVKGQVICNAYG